MEGKAWEIWSLVVTLDRQKVDTWGAAVPDKESRGKSFHKAVSIILFIIHDARDSAIQNRDYYGLPPVCPTLPHVTKSPRPSPSMFANCKQSKTGGGSGTWEQD